MKEARDDVGQLLQLAHRPVHRGFQLRFALRRLLGYLRFDMRPRQFIRIQFRRVGGRKHNSIWSAWSSTNWRTNLAL